MLECRVFEFVGAADAVMPVTGTSEHVPRVGSYTLILLYYYPGYYALMFSTVACFFITAEAAGHCATDASDDSSPGVQNVPCPGWHEHDARWRPHTA